MPMSISFSEQGLKTLMSPAPPAQPLCDIILTIKVSKDLNALAMMGRDIIRCCVRSRKYRPPIDSQFEIDVDEQISDRDLARVARQSLLLQRLKVDDVASDPTDIAHIFCAYLGATFMCSFKESGSNKIHDSINDLCAMVLDDDAREASEIDSHERMLNIPGLQRISTPTIKQEPAPSYSSSTRAPSTVSQLFDHRSIESVSSGRSPPPLSYGAHYQQSFQPYYPPPNANIAPPHMQPMHNPALHSRYSPYAGLASVHSSHPGIVQPQPLQYSTPPPPAIPIQPGYPTQPLGAIPPSGYPAMGMPQNPGFAPPPAPAPVPAPQQSQGYISLINELAMKNRRGIAWQQAKVGQQHMPEWTMWLSVDGQVRGQGTAPTKQAAKELASKAALQSLGWIQG
ncbi:double-stranded RNA-binding motif protein [Rhizoctonia solani AG-3 Rhs1AP]|uniref:Double-stranded RNA-binding motif protein n=2 Tax=Rhizoctonia solani AG-3 TaxID=1086053 RepID=A0A074RJR9_9AGAM|nr:double-stranded RNA-binding motif protein [Rhizoctonia solani AG-3 Rhs1AP]KEP47311.1 double-stranded RNA-binding motif protein [Rhizoctonia solani 123E]